MKMMDYFKSMMVIALKTFPMMLIALLILPLLFAFINGYSQRSHSPKNMEYLKNSLYIDGEGSEYGDKLIEILQDPEISKYIDVVDNKTDADFVLEINEGFKDFVRSQKLEKLYLKTNSRSASFRAGLFMSSIIESTLTTLIQRDLMIEAKNSNPDLDIDALTESNKRIQNETLNMESEYIETKVILNSYEKATLNSISFLILIWISNLITVHGNNKYEGFYKRMASMPVKPSSVYIIDYIGNTIVFALAFLVYIIITRLLGWGFSGNPGLLLIAVLVTSMLATSIGSLISEIVPSSVSNVVISLLIIIVALTSSLGHILNSIEKPNPLFKLLLDIGINERIYRLFKTVDSGFGSMIFDVFLGIAISMAFVCIGAIYVNKRKDVKI
ncbi:ABC transporter permease [Microaceticoccus formicicus]|uniref:ABC transporter permease n=1 Tax=Microaceticoccus formicicus TaxID=3118105 RepID=UPI003CD0087A|nr:ABC transporter permease [Peptoniphilaceae bacterium AMB_02]